MAHVPPTSDAAVASAFLTALKITFDALAEMYGRKDGAWVDELKHQALRSPGLQSSQVRYEVEQLFESFREELDPADWETPNP